MSHILNELEFSSGNWENTLSQYRRIWHTFNNFLIKLDQIPKDWEDRTGLFVANLIQNGAQSATVKSYVSAIKFQLKAVKYRWDEGKLMVNSLTRACKAKNDCITTRLPIHCNLMEMILFEVERVYCQQPYLVILFQAMIALGYYGLFRIGELTVSNHCIRACNIHSAVNKKKLLIVLYTSKTHDKSTRPQKVKISAVNLQETHKHCRKSLRCFCPFKLTNNYLKIWGNYANDDEPLFIFRSMKDPVKPEHARQVLKKCIANLGLNVELYNFHLLRIGRSCDLWKFGFSLEQIKRAGHWRSNAVYKYLRD